MESAFTLLTTAACEEAGPRPGRAGGPKGQSARTRSELSPPPTYRLSACHAGQAPANSPPGGSAAAHSPHPSVWVEVQAPGRTEAVPGSLCCPLGRDRAVAAASVWTCGCPRAGVLLRDPTRWMLRGAGLGSGLYARRPALLHSLSVPLSRFQSLTKRRPTSQPCVLENRWPVCADFLNTLPVILNAGSFPQTQQQSDPFLDLWARGRLVRPRLSQSSGWPVSAAGGWQAGQGQMCTGPRTGACPTVH